MGICGFKGSKDGVYHSIVNRDPDFKEETANPPPVMSKPVTNGNEGESKKGNADSTKQMINGEMSIGDDKDSKSEVHVILTQQSKRHSRKIRKKVEKIFADKQEAGDPTENFTKLERKKNVEMEMFILNSLQKHFLFSNLTDLQLFIIN